MWIVDCTLKERGFEYVAPPSVYRGPLSVHGTDVTVEITVSDLDFATLPVVRLVEAAGLGNRPLAHLIGSNDICYTDEDGLILDMYDPGGAVLRVLAQAAVALERSFAGGARQEYENELASYWSTSFVYFAIPLTGTSQIVAADVIRCPNGQPPGLFVVPRGAWFESEPTERSAATILMFATPLGHRAPFPARTLADALNYVAAQKQVPANFRQTILNATGRGEYIFLAAPNAILGWSPRLVGNLALVARKTGGFRPQFLRRILETNLTNVELTRTTGNETDLRFCIERNLDGRVSLRGKKIALVGCGTIGSYLAHMLVQNGAGCDADFVIYDNDILKPGNLGRHLLGYKDLGRLKVEAMADFLRGFHPDVRIAPRGVQALDDWASLEQMDLIIDATGDANFATALNKRAIGSDRKGDEFGLMHAWIFGNGVAAQSFLNLRDGHACYRCLQTEFGGEWRHNPLKNRTSPVRKAPARCGDGGYVPFPGDASIAAASLAVRAALDWVGGTPGHRLRTTIIDKAEGRENLTGKSPEALPRCDACGH